MKLTLVNFVSHYSNHVYIYSLQLGSDQKSRPPQLHSFVDELDTLVSAIPDFDWSLLILGALNIHPESPSLADFMSLV